MARKVEASTSLVLFLALLLLSLAPGRAVASRQKTWCVAKPSTDQATLTANLNYACSQVDCLELHKGYSCFYPDNLMSHASYAMNIYYQAQGRNCWNCHFNNSGLITTTDPSFGNCNYVFY